MEEAREHTKKSVVVTL